MTKKSRKTTHIKFYDELFSYSYNNGDNNGDVPVRLGMVSAEGNIVAASGIDESLRIWSLKPVKRYGDLKHTIMMEGPITALKVFGGMIFAATEEYVHCIKIGGENQPPEMESTLIPNIKKIRTDFGKVLLISDSTLFEWQNQGQPLVVSENQHILDARYITFRRKRALISVQSTEDGTIQWIIVNDQHRELQHSIESDTPLKLLDISHIGRLFAADNQKNLGIIGPTNKALKTAWKTSLGYGSGTGRFLDMDIMMDGRLVEEPVLFLGDIKSAFSIYGRIDNKITEITGCQLTDNWLASEQRVTIFPSAEIFPGGFILIAHTGKSRSMIVSLTQSNSGRKLEHLPSFVAIDTINTDFYHRQGKDHGDDEDDEGDEDDEDNEDDE